MWMIRSGRGGVRASRFLDDEIVAIGWGVLGIDLKKLSTREEVINAVNKKWPNARPRSNQTSGSQLFKFAHVLKVGDHVATYESESRNYYIGKIIGEYEHHPDADEDFTNIRKIEWDKTPITRDNLSQSARNSLGSTLTVFQIPEDVAKELKQLQRGAPVEALEIDDETAIETTENFSFDSMEIRATEFIKDRIMSFSWDEMQEFVAALLRAMGFKTQVSSAGPDRGKDILASPDGLGLSTPRVFVEVKHRPNTKMDAKEIRSFIGGRHESHSCLYVSTGGFTKEAYYEAERSNVPITIMNIDILVETAINYYEKMDHEGRQMLRLGKIFWPLD